MGAETILIIVGAGVGALVGMFLLALYLQWALSGTIRWIREEWEKPAKKDDDEGT